VTISSAALERAGIHLSPEEFEQLVLVAVEQIAPPRESNPARDLTAEQVAVIRRGGIDPFEIQPDSVRRAGPAASGASLYAAILATSLSVPEVARELGVDESRVRQRIHARTLYALKPGSTWRLPIFQFDDHRLVPGIDRVLPHLEPDLSPLTVVSWFEHASPNLVNEDGVAYSPLDWLREGRQIERVIEAAEDLARHD